jgi:predicted lipoprotein
MRSTPALCLSLLLCVSVFGCDKLSPSAASEGDSALLQRRRDLIRDVAERVIFPRYVAFEAATERLRLATQALAAAPSLEAWADARSAWAAAMDLWQGAEVFLIGPAGMMSQTPGGEDMRDELYSWPIVNPCRVDQELVEGAYLDVAQFNASEAVNVRGLDALEHLLFYEGVENACAPQSAINADGSWAAIPPDDLPLRRAQYAHTLSIDLQQRATLLRLRWDISDGKFLDTLRGAGQPGNTTYRSTQEALNALSDALFYVEAEVKDMKLGRPAGVLDCDTPTCPDALEHAYAERSRDSVLQNLLAFQDVFAPAPPAIGFADLLRDVNASPLADAMTQDLTDAIAMAQALPADLGVMLTQDLQRVLDLHAAVKRLGDNLKTEFISVLDLELPARAEGDND